ncbi:unnamed protein product [Musa textilis]
MRLTKRLQGQIHAVACLTLLPLNRSLRFTFGIQFFSKISEKKVDFVCSFSVLGILFLESWEPAFGR